MNATKIEGIALIILLAVSYGSGSGLGQTKAERGSGDQEQKPSEATAAKGKPPENSKIDPDVHEWLAIIPGGRLYVTVRLMPLAKEAATDPQRIAATKKRQDEFLAEIPPEVFKVGYRCERIPTLFGYVNKAGLQKLSRNPKVQSVQYRIEPEVHRRLRISSDGFAFAFIVVYSPKCDQLFERRLDTEEPFQAIAELEREVRLVQDSVLSNLSSKEFKLFRRVKDAPNLWGWISKEGLEELLEDSRVKVGWAPDEPPREKTEGTEDR